MVQVVRLGRKRKQGRRKPSGDLAADRTDMRQHVMNQPHRRALENKLDQRAESPLGGLNIFGLITDEQYEAGRLYAGIVGRYRAVIEAPKASASSCGTMVANGAEKPVGEFISEEEAERRKARYDSAYEALAGSGCRCARAVARVAVYGEACPAGSMQLLRIGLDALVEHFGLMARRDKLIKIVKS